MIAITKPERQDAPTHENEQFLKFVPDIERYARWFLRELRAEELEEAVCEVLAFAFCACWTSPTRLLWLDSEWRAFAVDVAHTASALGATFFRMWSSVGEAFRCRACTQPTPGETYGWRSWPTTP